MLILLLVLPLTFGEVLVRIKKKDPQQEYYCGIVCRNNYESISEIHVACFCNNKKNPPNCKPYKPDKVLVFREHMLNLHNSMRNYVASGKEKNPKIVKASNMNAVNYDVELEYVAMCTSMKCDTQNDPCRKTEKFEDVRQNTFKLSTATDLGFDKYAHMAVKAWYSGFIQMPDFVIDDFWDADAWADFATMMWWSVTHIGCAITTDIVSDGNTTIMITCNYGLLNEDLSTQKTTPIYKRGQPATACVKSTKNTGKYSSLCGEVHKAPTEINLIHPAYREEEPDSASILCSFNFIVIILLIFTVFR